MSNSAVKPIVGVSCCRKPAIFGYAHSVGEKYLEAVIDGAGAIPLLVPALGDRLEIDRLLERIDGLMLTGSASNVEPHHYDVGEVRDPHLRDPHRDATTLPLIRAAIERGIPLFAVCRGIQELNVALGGSLHQHVEELPGRRDHRSNKTIAAEARYGPVHEIRIRAGSKLDRILGGRETIEVNSLHAQAIDRLGAGLSADAVAEDGTIEAVSIEQGSCFCLGVQWHPEYRVREHPSNLALFEAFGSACRAQANGGSAHAGLGSVV